MNEEHVVVCVRHPDLGVVTRAFRPYETINAVYNWIGSLQKVPEHFRFYLPRGHVLTSDIMADLKAWSHGVRKANTTTQNTAGR